MSASARIIGTAPHLLVADIHRAAEYWTRVLGFSIERLWGEPPCFAMPRRDGFTIMLQQAPPNAPSVRHGVVEPETWDAYVWVSDAQALFAEFSAKGAAVAYPPTVRDSYDMLEFAVTDPDGHIIAFGQHWPAKA